MLSITRHSSSSVVSIIEFNPNSGPVGTAVTIFGTGFSATPSQNTVTFNGTTATVTSSTTTSIVATVPPGATTGPIGVTSPSGSATSSAVFTVTTATDAPTITGFTPNIGIAGTTITVTGTNFDLVPAQNTLRVNNKLSTVTSSISTSLNTTVPTITGSGRISVSTSRGKALSNDDFFIPPSPYTAADVVHTGRMAVDGASHTVTVNTANKVGLVVFDGTAGQFVSLGVSSTTFTGFNHRLYVNKPDGSNLVTETQFSGATNLNMTLPVTGTYTMMLDPNGTATGTATLMLSSQVNAGIIVVDGPSVTAAITRVGQIAQMTFSGTAGQFVSLGVSASTFTGPNHSLYVKKPDGSNLVTETQLSLSTNLHMTLPVIGTYTIIIDPIGVGTGSITLLLSSEVNAGEIVVDGASVTAAITRVGQRARMTFSGTAGQFASLGINSTTLSGFNNSLSVNKPDGTTLVSSGNFSLSTNFHMTLPVTGTYAIIVDPVANVTGNITLSLSSEVDAGTIVVDGASVTAAITRVGQRARMIFSGTAGQFASLGINSTTLSGFNNSLSVNKPDGTTLVSSGNFSLSTNFHMTLPVTGTYAIIVDPVANVTGNITLSLSSEVDAGTIVVDGASVTAAITRVGQRARMTFSGTAGQFASLGVNSTTIHFNSDLIVNKPDGSTLASDGSLTIDTNFHMTLPTTGTYVILIDAEGASTGNVTLTLSSELNAGTVVINGSPVSLSINRIGQRARLTFSGDLGQQATVRITNNTISNANVRLLKPDGSQLTSSTSSGSSFNLATQTLPTTGTYSILVDPGFTNTGSMSVSVTSP